MIDKISSKSREAFNIFGKMLLLFLLSLIFSLPLSAQASIKTLVIFPLEIYADQSKSYLRHGVNNMLISRLSGGDIEVIRDEKYMSLLNEKEREGITSKKRAEELARGLKADYAIFGSITSIGGGYSLDLSLLEIGESGSRLTRVSKAVDEDNFIPQLSDLAYRLRAIIEGKEIPARTIEEKATVLSKPHTAKGIFSKVEEDKQMPVALEKGLFFKPTREYQAFKPTGKISIGMTVMAFDMGDLDGRGGVELLVLGRKKLLLYTIRGASFALKDSLKAGLGEDFIKVSAGDVDNNGRAEIYLVSRYGMRARSTVLEWNGEFKRLDRRTGHLQTVKDPASSKPLLLFQDSKVDEFFSGRIYVMNYEKGGKLKKREKLPELKGGQFYTLALCDLDKDGAPEWLGLGEPGLGEQSNLCVWDQEGDIIWSGDKKLGGTNNAIRLEEGGSEGDLPPMISFNSRFVITDIDGDGKKEILAIKNISPVKLLQNLRVYTKSNLIAYRIEDSSLFPVWRTRDIDWCLTDMQVQGQSLFLAAQKGKWSHVGKGSSQIMWFE